MRHLTIPFILIVLSLTGCGTGRPRPDDLPKLYPCVLTITQEGNPLSGAYVNLIPMEEVNAKYQASSVTNDEGKATVVTYGFDGVPAGKYKVCVRKVVGEENAEYQTVERQYANPNTTPHEIEITQQKMPPLTFEVGKPIRTR